MKEKIKKIILTGLFNATLKISLFLVILFFMIILEPKFVIHERSINVIDETHKQLDRLKTREERIELLDNLYLSEQQRRELIQKKTLSQPETLLEKINRIIIDLGRKGYFLIFTPAIFIFVEFVISFIKKKFIK